MHPTKTECLAAATEEAANLLQGPGMLKYSKHQKQLIFANIILLVTNSILTLFF